jgi:Flp pilus assembly protein TadB
MTLTPGALIGIAATAAGIACLLAVPGRPFSSTARLRPGALVAAEPASSGWLRRYRWLLTGLAGAGGALLAPPRLSVGAAGIAVVIVWMIIHRAEPPEARHEREAARRDMVPLVDLIAAALAAGAPPSTAVEVACTALPGPAARRLATVRAELELGSGPAQAWSIVADDPVLAPLGRAIARADQAGAPVAATVSRLAAELAHKARGEVEDRARAVGVKAAMPLGICLLPSFLLLGIVPVAAGLLGSLTS